ncbi:MAG: PqqD family protein [Gemmatimonadota bacterium]|nr:PqqD family protein [Gemmatimonadota bacterium]
MRGRRDNPLAEVNLLEIAPARCAEWEEVDDRVIVIRPRPTSTGARLLLDRFLFELSAKRIRLDEIGSFVWRQLDGEHTVGEIASQLRGQYGDRLESIEDRLGKLIWSFRREEFVMYPGWDEKD